MLILRLFNTSLICLFGTATGAIAVVGFGAELQTLILFLASSTLVGIIIGWFRSRKHKRLTNLDAAVFSSTGLSEQDLYLVAKARASVQEEFLKTAIAYRLVTYPLYVLTFLVGVLLSTSDRMSFALLAGPVILGGLIFSPRLGQRLALRRRGKHRYALWLRRFHLARPETALRGLLMNMFREIAQIFTLRDDTFSHSYMSGLLKAMPHFLWILPLHFLLWAVLMMVEGLAYCEFHDIGTSLCGGNAARGVWSNMWIQSGNLLLVGLVDVLIIRRIMRRNGFSYIKSASQAASAVAAASRHLNSGISVHSCTPENWREVVETLLSGASAVVIDLREVSGSLVWEIEECSKCLEPSQVVIACVESDDKRREMSSLLKSDQHRTWFLECPLVVFQEDPRKGADSASVFVAYLQRALLWDQITALSK